MRPPILDPTAGERARKIRAQPATVARIPDPTDPRCGTVPLATDEWAVRPILDPTDPEYGSPAAGPPTADVVQHRDVPEHAPVTSP